MKIRKQPAIAPEALEALARYSWPGNVRELENLLERSLIVNSKSKDSNFLILNEVVDSVQRTHKSDLMPVNQQLLSLEQAVKNHIRQALKLSNGKVRGENGAARILNVNHNTLRSKMRKLGIAGK